MRADVTVLGSGAPGRVTCSEADIALERAGIALVEVQCEGAVSIYRWECGCSGHRNLESNHCEVTWCSKHGGY